MLLRSAVAATANRPRTRPEPDRAARRAQRTRRLGATGATNVLVQGGKIGLYLISIPLTLRYLSAERFGFWLTLSSLLAWLSIADLGLRNTLINILSKAHGQGDTATAAAAVSTALAVQAGMAVLLLAVAVPVILEVDWHAVFNISYLVSTTELRLGLAALVACLEAFLLANGISAIQFGYQEGHWANLWQAAGVLIAAVALPIAAHHKAPVWALILLTTGTPLVSTAASGVVVFGLQKTWLRPRWAHLSTSMVSRLLSSGTMYVLAQAAGAALFSSQNLIISHILGADRVGVFGITQKIVTLPSTVVVLLTAPLMAAVGEAYARGDVAWVTGTLARAIAVLRVTAIPAMAVLLLGFGPAVKLLTLHQISVNWGLAIVLAAYCVVLMFAQPYSVVLYGLALVRLQAAIAGATAVLTVAAGVILTTHWSLLGMGVAMLVPALLNFLAVFVCVRRTLGREASRF